MKNEGYILHPSCTGNHVSVTNHIKKIMTTLVTFVQGNSNLKHAIRAVDEHM